MFEIAKVWSDEMIEDLKAAVMEGKSASVIASEISTKHGRMVSRNSVIGKCHRMNISTGSNQTLKMKTDPEKRKASNERRIPKIRKNTPISVLKKLDFKNPKAKAVTFIDLREGMCKFPAGDLHDKTLRFCGAPADSNKSRTYCRFCYPILYIPSRPSGKVEKLHR